MTARQNTIFKKTVVVFVVVQLLLSPILIHAQTGEVPVSERDLRQKESGFFGIVSWDGLAFAAKELLLQGMLEQIKGWAASGFQGSPTFLENPSQFIRNVGEEASGAFIQELGNELFNDPNFFCSDIIPRFALDIGDVGFRQFKFRAQCTFTDVVDNVETHLENFNNGRWEAYLSLQQSNNNQFGSYRMLSEELARRQNEAKSTFSEAAASSGGYLPSVKCTQQAAGSGQREVIGQNEDGSPIYGDPVPDDPSVALCKKWTIRTPAKAIGDRITSFVGSDITDVIGADEMTELIVAAFKGILTIALSELSG
jgi:hypothetical protein